MSHSKTTTVNLPIDINKAIPEAEQSNELKAIIKGCTLNHYHDFKSPVYDCPKMKLCEDLSAINDERLQWIIVDIMNDEYDESPDAEDEAELRAAVGDKLMDFLSGKQPDNK